MTTNNADPARGAWMTFTADHDPADAVAKFERRYGRRPEFVIEDRRFRYPTLKVGPGLEVAR
jgi:hypothetical protein